jgi:hypothetical protein
VYNLSSRRLDLTPILLTFSIIIAIALLFLGVYKENTEFKSIEVYNANGTLLTTLEGNIHIGRKTYIKLENDNVMLPNSNFTYIEKELVD